MGMVEAARGLNPSEERSQPRHRYTREVKLGLPMQAFHSGLTSPAHLTLTFWMMWSCRD
jgi:hypothetical protein